ncbi:class I SAM-dependent methyltransferase [Candidatus Woesearchaeota archaeon]|nr:class I SAM-dependent methyltransferase [Candidatus Woesearchaeota archaeon]
MSSEHYFSQKQTSEPRTKVLSDTLRGNYLSFTTISGTFSKGRIDPGTKLLIESCVMENGWKALDFGCGYGAVGIAIAKAYPQAEITMVDTNERALGASRLNAGANGARNVSIVRGWKENNHFDCVLLYPPFHAGKKVCFGMIEQAKSFLKADGMLQAVARHNKGGSTMKLWMKVVFGNAEDTAKKSGYRVYLSRKNG